MVPRTTQRPTLSQALDKEIYQIVRKLADDQQYASANKLTVSTVYDWIKHSNSSLKRRPKKLLESCIERVLDVLKSEELDDADSLEGDFEGIDDSVPPPVKDHNIMNRSIVRMWANPTSAITPRENSPMESTPTDPIHTMPNSEIMNSPAKADRSATGEPKPKRRKGDRGPVKELDRKPPTGVALEDLGGVDDVILALNEAVAMPMCYPKLYLRRGIDPPRGVLLHGPPGCGKTMIAHAFAAEIGVSYIPLSAPSLVAGMSGESEKKIREVFEEAKKLAPCLVFIDEIDVIMGKRESAQREMEKRIVAQMLTCMDDMALEKTGGKPVIIIAATNRPDSLDPALRRAGRFNKEINLGVPNEQAREKILQALTKKLDLPEDFDYRALAKLTPGFVGADLNDVVSVAGTEAMKRTMAVIKQRAVLENGMDIDVQATQPAILITRSLVAHAGDFPSDEDVPITYQDFLTALPKVQPSAKREGFATIPDTTWAHIGAMHEVRKQLQMAIVEPIKDAKPFARLGVTAPAGVLLWGPPGCGKTLLAKAVANESKANFISIKGPELLNKYVGESERAVRQVFERARSSVPCILFFDELDALVPKRDDSLSEASSKVVNTLLTELDGMSSRTGIYVIAATNRPDIIDQAMLRPGRLGTSIFIGLPTPDERVEILKTLYRKLLQDATSDEVDDLEGVARDVRCTGYSGADLGSLHHAAAIEALERNMRTPVRQPAAELRILREDWEVALSTVKASVKDIRKYQRLRERGL